MEPKEPWGYYKTHYNLAYKWPKVYKRSVPEITTTKFQDYCKELKPEEPCICKAELCICKQRRRVKDDPVEIKIEPEDLVYLKGVKTLYQDTYCPEDYEYVEGILPTDPCPKVKTPLTRVWNPFLVPMEAYRPGQPRPLGCTLTFQAVTAPVDYRCTRRSDERKEGPSLSDIEEKLRFHGCLQERIAHTNLKPQKIAICRERPAAARRVF